MAGSTEAGFLTREIQKNQAQLQQQSLEPDGLWATVHIPILSFYNPPSSSVCQGYSTLRARYTAIVVCLDIYPNTRPPVRRVAHSGGEGVHGAPLVRYKQAYGL